MVTDRWISDEGDIVYGEFKQGAATGRGEEGCWRKGKVDLSLLDREVEAPRLSPGHDHARAA